MARTIGRLTALKVDKAKRPGMYADGGGLYLRVTQSGTKNWVFRFMLNGRPRWMGVGPLHTIGSPRHAIERLPSVFSATPGLTQSRVGVLRDCKGASTPRRR